MQLDHYHRRRSSISGRMSTQRCPKCRGNLYFESDVVERLLLRKCLQCGLIESYFWIDYSSRRVSPLAIESEQPISIE